MLYYIFKCIEFALTMRIGISPDEKYYFDVIRFFSDTSFFPWKWPQDITYGLLQSTPSLYPWIMGSILKLSPWADTDLVLLRLVNICFSIASVIYSFKITSLLSNSRLVRILSIAVITNIPMFTFLSSSISQDNLINMFGTIGIYFLIKTLRQFSWENTLPLLLITLLGLLTSITYIPLAIIIAILLMTKVFTIRKALFKESRNKLKWNKYKGNIVFIVFILFALIGTMNLYGTNIVKYRSIVPECELKYEDSYCSRMNTQKPYAILTEDDRKIDGTINPYDYFKLWNRETLNKSIGIFGHESILKPARLTIPYELMMLLSIFVIVRDFSLKKKYASISLGIILFCCLFLAYVQNYNTYISLGLLTSIIQGKNVFIVLGPIVALFCISLVTLAKNTPIKYLVVSIAITTFVLGDYVYFKREVPKEWYNGSQVANLAIRVNQSMR